jgi:hypothetical protein
VSINTNPSELGTISTNVTSVLTLSKEEHASIVVDTTSGKGTTVYNIVNAQFLPRIYSNTGTTATFISPLTGFINVTTNSDGVMIVDTNLLTSGFNEKPTFSTTQYLSWTATSSNRKLNGALPDYINLPDHKSFKVDVGISSVSSHPGVRSLYPLTITQAHGSSAILEDTNTGTSVEIALSTTTAPIFIAFSSVTTNTAACYGGMPQAFNPVYPTLAIAGGQETAALYQGTGSIFPTGRTAIVNNFEYYFREDEVVSGSAKILTTTLTGSSKGSINISTSMFTNGPGSLFDVGWSSDGKYLAGICTTSDTTADVVVCSMNTSTYVLSSVATATVTDFASCVVWNGSSQLFITGGNQTTGIVYNFNTSTNALTSATFPSELNGTSPVVIQGKFSNGNFLATIGASHSTNRLRIFNPSTSVVTTFNPAAISGAVNTAITPGSCVIGPAFGSSGQLQVFSYEQGTSSNSRRYIKLTSSSAGFAGFIYDSSDNTISPWLPSTAHSTSAVNGWCVTSFDKTKYGVISSTNATANANDSDIKTIYKSPGTSDLVARSFVMGDFRDFTLSSVFGSNSYVHVSSLSERNKIKIEPGQSVLISARNNHFFQSTGVDISSLIAVSEAV